MRALLTQRRLRRRRADPWRDSRSGLDLAEHAGGSVMRRNLRTGEQRESRRREGGRRGAAWILVIACLLLFGIALVPLRGHAIPADGDLNGDGQVDGADAVLMLRIVAGDLVPAAEQEERADIAPLGQAPESPVSVDAADSVLMLRAMSGEDVDGDGLDTDGENAIGSSPFLDDTDGDGHLDPDDPDPLQFSPPGIPTYIRIADGVSDISLTWEAPAGEVSFYWLHRYGTDGEYTFAAIDAAETSYLDADVSSGEVYFYWLQAVNSRGQEAQFVDCDFTDPQNQALWLTGALGPIPNPWSSAVGSAAGIDLSWEESADPAVIGYHVWLSSTPVPLGDTAGLVQEATVNGKENTSHTLSGLGAGTYYVRVTAFSSVAESRLDSARQLVVEVEAR
jgi:hypothetical protein